MTKNYFAVEPNNKGYTHIKIDTYYDKGGMNLFTYKENKRGYYVSVLPLTEERRDGFCMESYELGTGYKRLVKEVARASKKAEAEADAWTTANMANELSYACARYGLTLC